MTSSVTGERVAGAVMIIASLGTVIAMAHHPAGMHGGSLGGIVHGAMIVQLTLLAWGFLVFSAGLGASRPLILAALLTYAISLSAHVGAATINGFVVPALANPDAPPVSHDLFRFAWHFNQALAKLGVYMTGAAYLLWSMALLREPGRKARVTAVAGLIAGLVPAVLLASGFLRMDVKGAFIIYALHVAWSALVGAMMWSGLLQERGNSATAS